MNGSNLSKLVRKGTGQCQFAALAYTSRNRVYGNQLYSDGPAEFKLSIRSDADRAVGSLAITIYDQYGTKLTNADTLAFGQSLLLTEGYNELQLRIERLHLNPGVYVLGLWLADPMGVVFDHIESTLNLDVVATDSEGFGARPAADGMVTTPFSLLDVRRAEQAV